MTRYRYNDGILRSQNITTGYHFTTGFNNKYLNNEDLKDGFDGVDRYGRIWYGKNLKIAVGPMSPTGRAYNCSDRYIGNTQLSDMKPSDIVISG